MSTLLIINITGLVGTIISTISFIPQVYTTYVTQDIRGISYWFIILTIIGCLAWMVYAYYLDSWHQFFANFIVLILAIVLLMLYYSCDKKN
jgi:MtN3 and saliva related transmembrane protein